MTNPHRLSIGPADARIALARWGEDGSRKPPALLSHGTGFVAEVWDDIARELAVDYTVYALDRRGHGDSHKPAADRYHFLDFAEDVCTVIEALGLCNIYGIGHSAGATDLLLAAKLKPARFARLFAMEPTMMDPHAARRDGNALSHSATGAVQGVLRRQAEFDSAEAVFLRYRAAPAFAKWTESSLRAYVRHGFAPQEGAGCGCAAHPRSSRRSCSRSSRRWSKFTRAMPAAIHSCGCPGSAVRCGSPPLKTPGPSIKKWRRGPWHCSRRRADGASKVSVTVLHRRRLRCCFRP
jgi:pimeloyl-ACP methyl ester carboxylesterase